MHSLSQLYFLLAYRLLKPTVDVEVNFVLSAKRIMSSNLLNTSIDRSLAVSSPSDWNSIDWKQLNTNPRAIISLCIAIIVSVSALDTWLVYAYRESILHDERNPICELLIQLDPNHLSCFLLGKVLGNLAVIAVLVGLYRFEFRNCNAVAISVAGFQAMLMFYLWFSDPLTGLLHFDGLFTNNPILFRNSFHSLCWHLIGVAAIGGCARAGYRFVNQRKHPSNELFDRVEKTHLIGQQKRTND